MDTYYNLNDEIQYNAITTYRYESAEILLSGILIMTRDNG